MRIYVSPHGSDLGLSKVISELSDFSGDKGAVYLGRSFVDVCSSVPVKVFVASLNDISKSVPMSLYQFVALRYYIYADVADALPFSAVEVAIDEGDSLGSGTATTVSRADFDRLEIAEQELDKSELGSQNYELRILKIPGLYVRAFWLHGSEEIVIPLFPRPTFLTERIYYLGSGFVAMAAKAAELKSQLPDCP